MAGPAGGLTAEQQRVVAAPARSHVVVRGRPGTGRTTALLERSLRLVTDDPALRMVVLCIDQAAAARSADALLPRVGAAAHQVTITTIRAAARSRVEAEHGAQRVLGPSRRRRVVEALLRHEEATGWGELGPMLRHPGFPAEVADALADLAIHGEKPVPPGRWTSLQRFSRRYREHLAARGETDWPVLLAEAAALYRRDPPLDVESHVVVDDLSAASPLAAEVATALCMRAAGSTLSGWWSPGEGGVPGAVHPVHEQVLVEPLRRPEPGYLVTCRHPSLEAEAVAGELLAAASEGVAWCEMAVLVRNPARRGPVLVRALERHGIPVAPWPPVVDPAEPAVNALLDVLRWTAGDEAALARLVASPLLGLAPAEARQLATALAHARGEGALGDADLAALDPRLSPLIELRRELQARAATGTPAELAFEVWCRAATQLIADESGSEVPGGSGRVQGFGGDASALVAVLDALSRRAEEDPSERLGDFVASLGDSPLASLLDAPARSSVAGNAVCLTSISAAAGREWDTVVVAGCVEGELPKVPTRSALFDPELLDDSRRGAGRSGGPGERGSAVDAPVAGEEKAAGGVEEFPRGDGVGAAGSGGSGGPSRGTVDLRRRALAEERLLFETASTRPTRRLVAVAAPPPGVLVSRLVESWPERAARPLPPPGAVPLERPPTADVPVVPEGSLRLSASQLETYDDCPLRYAIRYVLGVRDPGGVHAELGSLVHAVLADFLDPATDPPAERSLEGLFEVAGRHWREDIARYRPQVEEVRRDLFSMLQSWWESEGSALAASDVLAVERRFEVDVGPHRLAGSIDRVDLLEGGGGGLRVVDYKTGKREPRPADVATNLQLAVYHLAAGLDPELSAHGPARQLVLRYLRSNAVYEQPVTPDHAGLTRRRVLDTADLILAGDFTPSVEADCRTCSFHRLCPLQDEGRQVGAA